MRTEVLIEPFPVLYPHGRGRYLVPILAVGLLLRWCPWRSCCPTTPAGGPRVEALGSEKMLAVPHPPPARRGVVVSRTTGATRGISACRFVVIFPGNIAQYLEGTDAFGSDTDRKRLVRLFFQPVLVLWALFGGDWLRRTRPR